MITVTDHVNNDFMTDTVIFHIIDQTIIVAQLTNIITVCLHLYTQLVCVVKQTWGEGTEAFPPPPPPPQIICLMCILDLCFPSTFLVQTQLCRNLCPTHPQLTLNGRSFIRFSGSYEILNRLCQSVMTLRSSSTA